MPDSPQLAADDDLEIRRYLVECLPADISIEALPPVPPGFTYDVGPNCPRDDLYYRLEARRALERLNPPKLAPIRRYR